MDTGLHRVYVTNEVDASMFGEPGDKPGQFNTPSEVAFDDHGNAIVVDTKNNRLQLVDSNQNAYPIKVSNTLGLYRSFLSFNHFFVQVDHQLMKPAGIHYDKENCELYVSNIGENTVVCFQFS